jgi:hypothetical protein
VREQVNKELEEEEQLQKSHRKELKTTAALHKKLEAEEAKAQRKLERERKAEERKGKAAELAAVRARSKSSNATLQPHKNLAIHQIKASEQPREALHQNLQRSVMLSVLETFIHLILVLFQKWLSLSLYNLR